MALDDDKELERDDGTVERDGEQREPIQRDDREDEGSDQEVERQEQEEDLDEEVDAKPSRESRFSTLSNAAREATERAAAAERRAQELEQRLSRLEKPVEQEREPTPEEKALWSVEDHIRYNQERSERRYEQRLNQMQFQMADNQDRSAWAAHCATDPRAKQLANDVEQRTLAARQQGYYLSRWQMYTFMVGEKALQRGTKAADTQRQQGQKRIERQQVKGTSSKGDESRRGNAQLSESEQRNARLRERGFFDA